MIQKNISKQNEINQKTYEEGLLKQSKIVGECVSCHKKIMSNEPHVIESVQYMNSNTGRNSVEYYHNNTLCWILDWVNQMSQNLVLSRHTQHGCTIKSEQKKNWIKK